MTRQQEQLRTQRLTMLADELDPRDCINEAALERVIIDLNAPRRKLTIKPAHYVIPFCVAAKKPRTDGHMHCEHLYAYYRTQPKLKGLRFDAYDKMAYDYKRAARDAAYAATFWRA